jgi:hypothetical protein
MVTQIKINEIHVFRFIHIDNLEFDLINGLFAKNHKMNQNFTRKLIANSEIIQRRDQAVVKCYPATVVNDYVPFYFSVRTPMLFNIKTGWGVPQISQQDIVYIVCQLNELTTDSFQWCFTNGNAVVIATNFYSDLECLQLVNWKSIQT